MSFMKRKVLRNGMWTRKFIVFVWTDKTQGYHVTRKESSKKNIILHVCEQKTTTEGYSC